MEKLTERFEMRLSEKGVRRLDEWRRKQDDLPSRAEAIRRLIDFGLEAWILTKLGNAQVSDGNDIEWADAAEALYKLIVKVHDAGAIGEADMNEANRIFGTAYADGMLRLEERQKEVDRPQDPNAPLAPGKKRRIIRDMMKPED